MAPLACCRTHSGRHNGPTLSATIITLGNALGIVPSREILARLRVDKANSAFWSSHRSHSNDDPLRAGVRGADAAGRASAAGRAPRAAADSEIGTARGAHGPRPGAEAERQAMQRLPWRLKRTVLTAHRRMLAAPGGASRVELPRLALALDRPKTVLAFAHKPLWLFGLAAACREALLRVGPFANGSQRMAFLLVRPFVSLDGMRQPAATAQAAAMFCAYRLGAIDREHYSQSMRSHWLVSAGRAAVDVRRDRTARDVRLLLRGRSAKVRVAQRHAPLFDRPSNSIEH